jgi:hypothetical protein
MKIGHLQKIFTSDIDENNVMTYWYLEYLVLKYEVTKLNIMKEE